MSRETENVVCRASYAKFFGHFLVSEFFNSHACLHQLTSGLCLTRAKSQTV
jgi:hypothetical protein